MNPLSELLEELVRDNPDGFQVVVFFTDGTAFQGALRGARNKSNKRRTGLFELAGVVAVNNGSSAPSSLMTNFFSGDRVSRIMLPAEQPKIVTPKNSGGIVIPH